MYNGIQTGADSIVHDMCMMLRRVSSDPEIATVSTNKNKAFNWADQYLMLDLLPSRSLMLVWSVNIIKDHTHPHLFIPIRQCKSITSA